ncbi:MAG: hypothetical protein ACLQJR_09175 [Stellaceae bacterium]
MTINATTIILRRRVALALRRHHLERTLQRRRVRLALSRHQEHRHAA